MDEVKVVIKFGGHAMIDLNLCRTFALGLAHLAEKNIRFVLVHGGGPQINTMLKHFNVESHFINGLRVTDAQTMQIVEMVLCGQVNKQLVSMFQSQGLACVGISGKDANILQAKPIDESLGFVGNVEKVDTKLLEILLNNAYMPIVAPVAVDCNGNSLNVNADTAAGAIAGALGADYFIFVSDVPGVLDAQKQLMPTINRATCQELIDNKTIHGGMLPKIKACLNALDAGCKRALILDGSVDSALENYLMQQAVVGTVVENV